MDHQGRAAVRSVGRPSESILCEQSRKPKLVSAGRHRVAERKELGSVRRQASRQEHDRHVIYHRRQPCNNRFRADDEPDNKRLHAAAAEQPLHEEPLVRLRHGAAADPHHEPPRAKQSDLSSTHAPEKRTRSLRRRPASDQPSLDWCELRVQKHDFGLRQSDRFSASEFCRERCIERASRTCVQRDQVARVDHPCEEVQQKPAQVLRRPRGERLLHAGQADHP